MTCKEKSQAGKQLSAGKCLYLTGNHQASQENIWITHRITAATTLGTGGQGRRPRLRSQGAQHKVARGRSQVLCLGQSAVSVMLCELAQRGSPTGRGVVAVQLLSRV